MMCQASNRPIETRHVLRRREICIWNTRLLSLRSDRRAGLDLPPKAELRTGGASGVPSEVEQDGKSGERHGMLGLSRSLCAVLEFCPCSSRFQLCDLRRHGVD